MRSIEVLGAAGEVTGSAYQLVSNKGTKLLVDCGLFQGQKFDIRNKSLNGHDTTQLAAVIITHAHLDHVGRLPQLRGDAPIYMTAATRDLTSIVLRDSAKISKNLYEPGTVDAVLSRIICVPYDKQTRVDGLSFTLRDAGHILGSSSVEIQETGGDKVVFSGDLGNTPSRIVRPTTLIEGADLLVTEATYGDRNHSKEGLGEVITEAIEIIKKNRGTLLMPVFAIDRSQIALNKFKELSREGVLKGIPVFFDSPMAMEATKIYNRHMSLLNDGIKQQDSPFYFPELIKTLRPEESWAIWRRSGPKVIIAGSGMMTGGRIADHAKHYLPYDNTVVLLVGFPAEGTPSRALAEGKREVIVDNVVVDVRARIMRTSGSSAHADQSGLLSWTKHIFEGNRRLRGVVIGHGEDPARKEYSRQLETRFGIEQIWLPKEGEAINLHSGEIN